MNPIQMPVFNRLYQQATKKPTLPAHRPQNKTGDVVELRFAGKKAFIETVEVSFLDTNFSVPRAVFEAKESVKTMLTQEPDGFYAITNAIAVADELFLTVAHGINEDVEDEKYIGNKVTDGDNYAIDEAMIMDRSNTRDMAVMAVAKENSEFSIGPALTFARRWYPNQGDELFIVAGHSDMSGTQIIPATFTSRKADFNTLNPKHAKMASLFYELSAPILAEKEVQPTSLSGGAVVNTQGELVGMLVRAESNASTDTASGRLFFIPIHTLRQYLVSNGALG